MQRQTLQSSFAGGVIRDIPRHELPVGSVWMMTDFIPNRNGEPLTKRGAWSKVYSNLANAIKALAWAPFNSGALMAAVTSDGHFQTLANHSGVITTVDKGAVPLVTIARTQVGSNQAGSAEIQVSGIYASGGTWKMGFNGQSTSALTLTVSGASLQTALNGLSSIPAGGVTVAKTTGTDGSNTWSNYTITFVANGPQNLFTIDGSGLTEADGDNPVAYVSRSKAGIATLVQDEIQTITITATSGTFPLSFNGQTTSALAFNASTATVQTALRGLSTIGGANVNVTGSPGAYIVTFVSGMTLTPQPLITGDGTNLVNTGSGTIFGTLRPVFFNDTFIWGKSAFDGSHAPQDMSLVFPNSSLSQCVYKSRLVTSDGKTLYFSNVLDHTSWDVDSFVGAGEITAVAPLSGMIMIFSGSKSQRLRGTTPPTSTSAGDFILEPAFSEGCTDAGSVVTYRDNVIWANENGVHMTDGAARPVNLIERGGLKQYWKDLMATMYPSASLDQLLGTIAAGIYDNHYVVSVIPHIGSATTMLCDLDTGRWIFFGNLPVLMFAESQLAARQLFMAVSGQVFVGELSTCFSTAGKTSSALADPDGTVIQPSLELPFYRFGSGNTRFRDMFIGVDIDNSSGGTGTLYFDYVANFNDPSSAYTVLNDDLGSPLTVTTTTGPQVKRIPLHLLKNGLGLRIRQVGGSRKTALHELEANVRVLEGRYT